LASFPSTAAYIKSFPRDFIFGTSFCSINFMKVILLRDVARLGKRLCEADVPDGFARNLLIPRGDAVPATPENKQRYERLRAQASNRLEEERQRIETALDAIGEGGILVTKPANERGHLFGALLAAEVARAARERGLALRTEDIIITHPIRDIGRHTLQIRFGDQSRPLLVTVKAAS
jgi:large subunit ribosomal protein L9